MSGVTDVGARGLPALVEASSSPEQDFEHGDVGFLISLRLPE